MWQNIAVIIIGVGTIVFIGRKIYYMLTIPKDPANPCCGCSGCALKDNIETINKRKKNKKSCPEN